MSFFDPGKWIDGIKSAISAGASYKFALAAICGIYWYLSAWHYVPTSVWQIQASSFGCVFFTLLWVANVVSVFADIFRPRDFFVHRIELRRQSREVENYLPHLGEKEREIIAYLLAHNQKSFIAAMDGGHAMLLITRAIVIPITAPGQVVYQDRMPMIIPDHIWVVLQRHKASFQYVAPTDDEIEVHPWRRHHLE